VVSFTPWPLYPQGNRAQYPSNRSLVGSRTRSERCGEETVLPGRLILKTNLLWSHTVYVCARALVFEAVLSQLLIILMFIRSGFA
jgi:hypothetical protein